MQRLSPSSVMAGTAVLLGAIGLLLPRLVPGVPPAVAVVLVVTALVLLLLALAWRGRSKDACDVATPSLRRRYTRELMLSMAAYVVVLLVSVWLLRQVEPTALRVAIALAPAVPIGFAIRAMVRFMRGIDEMQQRIELEAISVATVFVSMLYLTGGLLQSARLIDVPAAIAMIWVFPMICASYGIAKAFVMRRYG